MKGMFYRLFLLFYLIPATSWATPLTLSVIPSTQMVGPGDIFTVGIEATLLEGEDLTAWGLDLTPTGSNIIQVGAPVIAPIWSPPLPGGPAPGYGCIDGDGLCGTHIFPPGSPTGPATVLLATVGFEALIPGLVTFALTTSNPPDLDEGFLGFNSGFLTSTFKDGEVKVTPEPSTMLLLSTGLISVIGWTILRQRQPG